MRRLKRVLKSLLAIGVILLIALLFIRYQGVQYVLACAGGGFVRPLPAAAAYATERNGGKTPYASGPITVVTYNIFNGSAFLEGLVAKYHNGDLGGFLPWSQRVPEIRDRIASYNPDLIGLQEMDADTDVRAIVPDTYTLCTYRIGKFQWDDAALLFRNDRFDLLDSGQFFLGPTPDLPMAFGYRRLSMIRYVNWAVLREKSTGFTFLFANTHFDNAGANKEPSATLFHERFAPLAKAMPIIVTGDFNSTGETPRFQRLCGASGSPPALRDVFYLAQTPAVIEAAGPARSVRPEEIRLRPERRIDHILIGGPCKAQTHTWTIDLRPLKNGQPMSDHDLIAAQVQFKQ